MKSTRHGSKARGPKWEKFLKSLRSVGKDYDRYQKREENERSYGIENRSEETRRDPEQVAERYGFVKSH